VTETGGDEKEVTRLTKEIRSAVQKAKSDVHLHPTSKRYSQRWSSTDEDYMPDRPQSRSAVRSDLEPRSQSHLDSRSRSDNRGNSLSRQQRARTEDGYVSQRSTPNYDDGDSYVRNGLQRTKTNWNRSFRTNSPCKICTSVFAQLCCKINFCRRKVCNFKVEVAVVKIRNRVFVVIKVLQFLWLLTFLVAFSTTFLKPSFSQSFPQ